MSESESSPRHTRWSAHHREHDRTSCSDAEVFNADPEGSTGCARCTALLLDQRDELLATLKELAYFTASKGRLESARVKWMDERIHAALAKSGENT